MSTPNKKYETEDGPIYYSRSVAVVHAVIAVTDDTYMLLTKRSDTMEDEPGKWCIPCGYLDWDENLEEAAIREVKEETKLDLTPIQDDILAFCLVEGISSSPESSKRQNVSIRFLSVLSADELPEVGLTEETSEVGWFTRAGVLKLKDEFAFNHFRIAQSMFLKANEEVF